jgi:hypothetical protein
MMAIEDILQRGVKVTLDRERVLMYPMYAMAYLAEQYGSVMEAFKAFQNLVPKGKAAWGLDGESIKLLSHFLVAGLMTEDETITFKEVQKVLDMNNMAEAVTAVSEAMQKYLPQVKEGTTPPQRPKN